MKDIEKLRIELKKNFLNNETNIKLNGDISYSIKIKNVKFLLNKIYLILSDNENNQLNICLDEVGRIEIKERYIKIYFHYDQIIEIFT